MIRVGVLGCGRIARIHHLALSAFARAVRERSPVAPDLDDGERSLAPAPPIV